MSKSCDWRESDSKQGIQTTLYAAENKNIFDEDDEAPT